MMTCPHQGQLGKASPPAAFSKVYKDECTLCFLTPDCEDGINVCLTCFNGACAVEHSMLHYRKTGHCLVLNIKRTINQEEEDKVQPTKITKLEIQAEQEDPDQSSRHVYDYKVGCLACSSSWTIDSQEVSMTMTCVKAIISSTSAKKRMDVQAWQELAIPCEHSQSLVQLNDPSSPSVAMKSQCGDCDLKENLWLCLSCGSVGCGRRQYDGSGGNGHGADHFEMMKHPLAVKLGTITPEGTADVHCYICNELRIDPNLTEHLATFGIDVSGVEKTEKSMAELQLEQNLKFDFSMVTDDGRQLEPVYGAGCVGLKNLGNSCYLNSIVQSLFHTEPFQSVYCDMNFMTSHLKSCHKDASACFICQSLKLGKALWPLGSNKECSSIIAPWMFRAVVAQGHVDFSTPKQQDASEFLSYLLKVVQRSDPVNGKGIVNQFTFTQQQELKCSTCGNCKYQKVSGNQLFLQIANVLNSVDSDFTLQDSLTLDQFLDKNFCEEELEAAKCSQCNSTFGQVKKLSLLSFPKYLVITVSRYVMRNWVLQKLEMPVKVPFESLDLAPYRGIPLSSSAVGTEMGEEEEESKVDQNVLAELISMGFPPSKCKQALIETGNKGIEVATNWIFENENVTTPPTSSNNKSSSHEQASWPLESIEALVDAGFTEKQAGKALRETDGDLERAFDWILSHPDECNSPDETINTRIDDEAGGSGAPSTSTKYKLISFISHKGSSVHCGHYVSHILHPKLDQWMIFNDERVALVDPQPPSEAAEKAYMFVYQRIDQ